jgi:methylmalonyl-CoA carboxyltransferase large subunit
MEHAVKTEAAGWDQVAEGLEALRRELACLGERVAALEKLAAPGGPAPAAPVPVAAPAPAAEGISEELVLVIGAAVAAFLGKKPHIRQIRLLGGTGWSQAGRVTIQASHTLETPGARRQP